MKATGMAWVVSVPTKILGRIVRGCKALNIMAPIAPAPIDVSATKVPISEPPRVVNGF